MAVYIPSLLPYKKFEGRYECNGCGDEHSDIDSTGNGYAYEHWYMNYDINGHVIGMLCKKCNEKYVRPKRDHSETNAKLYRYAGQFIYGWTQKRTGYCSLCPNNKWDGSCKATHLHHEHYVRILPFYGRVEICAPCHYKITSKEFPRDQYGRRIPPKIKYNNKGQMMLTAKKIMY
jgi:hypothetical protein